MDSQGRQAGRQARREWTTGQSRRQERRVAVDGEQTISGNVQRAGNRHKTQDACSVIQVAVARCINTNESTTTTTTKAMMRPQRSQHTQHIATTARRRRSRRTIERQQQEQAMGNVGRRLATRLQQRRLWHWPYTFAHIHTHTHTRPP